MDNDGGPAFPSKTLKALGNGQGGLSYVNTTHGGMSLRDWFAGQALMGFMACRDGPSDRSVTARFCFEYADAMLAARKTEAA